MRRLFSCSLAWLFLVALAGTTGSVAWAEPPAARPARCLAGMPRRPQPTIPRARWNMGSNLERSRNWAGAIETYHAALERWPSRVDFSRRLRLCEIHFKLSRRYLDTSFRNVLLRLPHEQAVDLYDEVVERIQTNYVDPVPLEPLVRHGLDNLEVALRDPVFVKTNAPAATPERVTWLRETLRQYRAQLNVPDRAAAIRLALDRAARRPGRPSGWTSTPVLLEFTCGACDALDDFTSYLTPDKLEDLYAMIDGNFVGLGVELKIDKEGLRPGRRDPGRTGVGGGHQGRREDREGRRPLDQGTGPGRGRQPAPRGRGNHARPRGQAARRTRSRRFAWSAATSTSRASPKSGMVDPTDGIGYLQLTGFQKTSADEIDKAVGTLVRPGNEGAGARPPGQSRAACSTSPSRSPSGSSTRA